MARTVDPALTERNRRLVADAQANPFQSDEVLARKHGVGEQRVRQILSEAGVISKDRRRRPQKAVDMKSISNLHVFIGQIIQEKFTSVLEVRPMPGSVVISGEQHFRELALHLKFTTQTLRKVTCGTQNLTISDLQRIAEWMDISPSKLLTECEKRMPRPFAKSAVTTGSFAVSST
jgi:transcriptional regulator with XRE-family HTH domain